MSTMTGTAAGASPVVVYFSRAGENYFHGGRTHLEVGSTQVLAEIVAGLLGCPIHRIEPADPYPEAYEPTVARNAREQEDEARPAIVGAIPDLAGYDVVLLGSPIWNVAVPRIMRTFVDGADLRGKAVAPFTTHAMSGLGTAPREYARACRGARILPGLAVRGEEADGAGPAAREWLSSLGLLR